MLELQMNSQARSTRVCLGMQSISKHTQACTQRCDLAGEVVKRCYVRKHLTQQIKPHKASACSEARTRGSAPHISVRGGMGGEGGERRASDQMKAGHRRKSEGARNPARMERTWNITESNTDTCNISSLIADEVGLCVSCNGDLDRHRKSTYESRASCKVFVSVLVGLWLDEEELLIVMISTFTRPIHTVFQCSTFALVKRIHGLSGRNLPGDIIETRFLSYTAWWNRHTAVTRLPEST